MNTRRKGFILLPVVLATFIMGMLGIGLASMYSGTFSTMNAGKAASKAKDFATIEGNYIKLNGYDTAASMTHDWESLSDLVGPDGSEWQSKVENSSTSTTADGDQVKVMKVAVKKNSDIASRYTYEVPVVNGKDTYTKAEIDAMMSVVNGNFTKVNNRIDELANKSDNIQSQIDGLKVDISTLNTNLSKLNTLVENYRTSLLNSINQEIADRKAADSAESSARIAADNKLNQRCDAINKSIQDLQNSLNTTNERLNSEIQARKDADAAIRRDMTSIQNELTTKYTNLQSTVSQLSDKVTNMGSKVDTNTNKIASINELLKNSFVFNGKRDTGISLAYDATSKSMKAYYNGQEVALGSQGGDFIRYEDIKESEKIACEISAKAIDYREIYVNQSGLAGQSGLVCVCQGVEILSFIPAGVKESVNRKYFLNDTNIKSDRQLYLGKVCLSETFNPTLSFMSQDELPLKISGLSYGEYHTVIYDAVRKFLKQRGLSDEQIHSVQINPKA